MLLTLGLFAAATVVVVLVGPRMADVAVELAARTGLGQVLFGAIFVGASTSLPGIVLTVSATLRGQGELAVGNAIGGVIAQTAFIALADLAYRRRALSRGVPMRQVASQSAVLLVLLGAVVVGASSPGVSAWGVHPVTPLLLVAYAVGLAANRRLGREGELAGVQGRQAAAHHHEETAGSATAVVAGDDHDEPAGDSSAGDRLLPKSSEATTGQLWLVFAVSLAVLAGAGYTLSVTGGNLADQTFLSQAAVGAVLTAFATSTPELVTAVAAARRGAIGLAAGDIIGGNTFDVLFVAAADLVVPDSTIFAAFGQPQVLLVGGAIVFNAVLLEGLLRQGDNPAGWVDRESVLIVAGYLTAVVLLFL